MLEAHGGAPPQEIRPIPAAATLLRGIIRAMRGLLPIRQAPIEIANLATAPLGQLHLLPASGGVYLATDTANRVWYIGLAGSIRERLRVHDRLPDFRKKGVTSIAWQPEADDKRCRELEKELIEFFHPPLNSQHNFNELPRTDLGLSPDAEIELFLRLKIQLKLIGLELEALKPNIVTHCEQAGGELAHQLGTIRYQTYPLWQFSEDVELLKRRFLQLQKEEKENGRAVVKSETTSPIAKLDGSAIISELAIRLSPLFETDVAEAAEEVETAEENDISFVSKTVGFGTRAEPLEEQTGSTVTGTR